MRRDNFKFLKMYTCLMHHYFSFIIHIPYLLYRLSGGTDIIACFMGHNWNIPVYRGEIQGLILGCDMKSWDENGSFTSCFSINKCAVVSLIQALIILRGLCKKCVQPFLLPSPQ